MNPSQQLSTRVLSIVWFWTGVVSLVELSGQSTALLEGTLIHDPVWQQSAIIAGALLDLALGWALWHRPGRRVYEISLACMMLMTVVATVLTVVVAPSTGSTAQEHPHRPPLVATA